MLISPEVIQEAISRTVVLRPPKQSLSTFGITSVDYYLVSEPIYEKLDAETRETVIRKGRLTAGRPQIVTPYYLLNLFHGFEHGVEFAQYLAEAYGSGSPGLLYSYSQELQETSIVSDPLPVVAGRIVDQLEKDDKPLSAVIQGVDHLWDISLMKFIYEITISSLTSNVSDLHQRGLLQPESGLPRAARIRIEELFTATAKGQLDPRELKTEIDRWGVFEEYQDRFFGLFRK